MTERDLRYYAIDKDLVDRVRQKRDVLGEVIGGDTLRLVDEVLSSPNYTAEADAVPLWKYKAQVAALELVTKEVEELRAARDDVRAKLDESLAKQEEMRRGAIKLGEDYENLKALHARREALSEQGTRLLKEQVQHLHDQVEWERRYSNERVVELHEARRAFEAFKEQIKEERKVIFQASAIERYACATECDQEVRRFPDKPDYVEAAQQCARRIRERGR